MTEDFSYIHQVPAVNMNLKEANKSKKLKK